MDEKRILIVDDSRAEQIFLSELLAQHGYACTLASSTQEATQQIAVVKPDLILLDVVMPGMNGYQYMRELRKSALTASIPVFICSSKNQTTDRVWGLRQGAREYFCKPIVPEDLLEKIRQLFSLPGSGRA